MLVQDGGTAGGKELFKYTSKTYEDMPYVTSLCTSLRVYFKSGQSPSASKGFEFRYREGKKDIRVINDSSIMLLYIDSHKDWFINPFILENFSKNCCQVF